MVGCRGQVGELARLSAVDAAEARGVGFPDWATSLVIFNPLAAPIFVRFDGTTPTATNYDIACPGEALMAYPMPNDVRVVSAVVDYPGAVPGADAGQVAILSATEDNQGVFVGPLNV